MGLKRIGKTGTMKAKKTEHAKNKTINERLSAVEKLLGLR